MTTLEAILLEEFTTNETKTTGVLIDNCARRMGIITDDDFAHSVRGAQQMLKKKGVIEHLGYNKWRSTGIYTGT